VQDRAYASLSYLRADIFPMNVNGIVNQMAKPLDKNDIAKIKELKKKGLSEESLPSIFTSKSGSLGL